eukprot:11967038-Karenia_brevis.AAC.1
MSAHITSKRSPPPSLVVKILLCVLCLEKCVFPSHSPALLPHSCKKLSKGAPISRRSAAEYMLHFGPAFTLAGQRV